MAITSAKIDGSFLRVYDGDKQLYSKFIPAKIDAILIGFTASSVSVEEGDKIKVYDEKGRVMSSHLKSRH